MSEDFAYMHGIKYEHMNTPIVVNTLAGQCRTSMVSPNVTLKIEGTEFHVSPIFLKSSHIELILGMDWLKAPTASTVCGTRTVHLLHPSNEIVSYNAHLVRDAEARIYCFTALHASPHEGIEHV